MESHKTQLLITIEKQKVMEMEAETARKQNVIKAQSEAEISKINKLKEINEQESKKRISEIENEMNLARVKSHADAEFCKNTISNSR